MDDAEILKYRPLVISIARWFYGKYRKKSTLDDLVQAGWLGMLAGLKSYDSTRGVTLGAYSRAWIWGAVYKECHGKKTALQGVAIGLPDGLEAPNGSTVEARDTLATLTPEARQFVEYLWLENETPQTACDRMGLIFVDPGKMLKEIQQLIRSAII